MKYAACNIVAREKSRGLRFGERGGHAVHLIMPV